MALRFYIKHTDFQTLDEGCAFFGPFSKEEIDERLNDNYAESLASYGELECVRMQDRRVANLYINSRDYWMTQLKDCEDWLSDDHPDAGAESPKQEGNQ